MVEGRELLELFISVLRKMKKEWARQLEYILTPSQYFILRTLSCYGPQKATELAEMTQMSPGAITGVSDKLVLEGYAQRKRGKEDRRVVYLEITSKGRELVELLVEKQKNVTAEFFEGLSDQDINHLIRIYQQISSNLDQIKNSKHRG